MKSLLLVCLGIVSVAGEAPCAEPESPAMVRIVNLVGPKAKIVATLGMRDDQIQTRKATTKLKNAPYPSLGDYVSVEGGREYSLDVEGSASGVGGFGSQQTLTLRSGHRYTLLIWGSVNVKLIDQQALFPFEDDRLANVVILAATKNDSDSKLSNSRHFVFGNDDAGSRQFAFALQSKSFAGILRGDGARANVLEAFQTTAGKLPLRVLGAEDVVLVRGDLTLEAKETHFVVVIGEDKTPEVVFIANGTTKRLEK